MMRERDLWLNEALDEANYDPVPFERPNFQQAARKKAMERLRRNEPLIRDSDTRCAARRGRGRRG